MANTNNQLLDIANYNDYETYARDMISKNKRPVPQAEFSKTKGSQVGMTKEQYASDKAATGARPTISEIEKVEEVNKTPNAMEGDSRYAPKVQETEEDTWQTRIKNGKASDDDMKKAYEEYKAGKYNPGPKTLEYFQKYFENQSDTVSEEEVKSAVASASGSPKEAQSLWEKLKGKLKNKDLEEYAKENGISYGQALRYTMSSMLKGLANSYQPFTGVKPFADEDTLSPLEKRYRVTSGKTDEQFARSKESDSKVKYGKQNKEAAITESDIEGTGNAQKDISEKWWSTKNGQTYLDFAQLNADIKNIEDTQMLTTLEKQLGIERTSAMALQKFLTDLSVDANYRTGLNAIQLKTDEVGKLADYLDKNPSAVEGYKQFLRKQTEGGMSTAAAAKQWVDLVLDPAIDMTNAVGGLVDAAVPM